MRIKGFVVLAIVLFAIAIFGCNSKESPSPQQSVNEAAAISELMGIRGQINTYMRNNSGYPETLESMRESLGVPITAIREASSFRYKYAKTESGWECYAVPLSKETGSRSFYVCEDGVIRVKEGIHDTDGKRWTTK